MLNVVKLAEQRLVREQILSEVTKLKGVLIMMLVSRLTLKGAGGPGGNSGEDRACSFVLCQCNRHGPGGAPGDCLPTLRLNSDAGIACGLWSLLIHDTVRARHDRRQLHQ
jgi:hypothetical protein